MIGETVVRTRVVRGRGDPDVVDLIGKEIRGHQESWIPWRLLRNHEEIVVKLEKVV